MAYRTHLHIIRDILKFCEESQLYSHILGKCTLSYTQVRDTLPSLLAKGLLVEVNNQYTTTAKGEEYVKTFEVVERLLE